MRPRTKSSLLWGVVGGLSFLVLIQGFELLGDPRIGAGTKFAVALFVGAVTVRIAYGFEGRLGGPVTSGANGKRPSEDTSDEGNRKPDRTEGTDDGSDGTEPQDSERGGEAGKGRI